MREPNRKIRIGLLGCGYVGSGVATLAERNRSAIRRRLGADLVVERILVRDASKRRTVGGEPLAVDPARWTTDAGDILEDSAIDLVVEAIGGVEPAGGFLRRALEGGKPVATANKALVAEQGPSLSALAEAQGISFGYEASVCGAIPILHALKDSLAGDEVLSLSGVVNATCNFILTRVEAGLTYEEALAEARAAGYTEADPSLDVDGIDAAQKLSILAWAAFGELIPWREIPRAGIRGVSPADIASARQRGKTLRSVARAERSGGRIRASVGLLEVATGDPLAVVRGEANGVRLLCRGAGSLFFSGPGAGSLPTASALLADAVRAAQRLSGEPVEAARI